MVKRFILIPGFIVIFFISVIFSFYFSTPVVAANLLQDKQAAIIEGSNQEAWLNEALNSNMTSMVITLGGTIPDSVINGISYTYTPQGALGTTTQLISSLYNPPASGTEYIAMLKGEFLGQAALAQDRGIGFAGLSPILGIWRGFRNVIYLLSAVIFVLIGLMIIFRVKINPQTVISIQNAIPSLVTALILVTFSYAIAGFLIDLIYFVQSFFIALLFQATGTDLSGNLIQPGILNSIANLWHNLWGQPTSNPYDFAGLSNPGLGKTFFLMERAIPHTTIVIISVIVGAIVGVVAGLATAGPGLVLGIGAGVLVLLIIQVIVLISLLKFFFGLVKAYLNVIIRIIIAPLEIGMGAFPNSPFSFSSWIRNLIAYLSVFPISFIFLVLVNILVQKTSGGLWAPTVLAGTVNGLIPAIIGLGGIMILGSLPDLIPQVVFQIKPSPFGAAIGQGFAPGAALGWAGAQRLSDDQQRRYVDASANNTLTGGQKAGNFIFNALSYLPGSKVKRNK